MLSHFKETRVALSLSHLRKRSTYIFSFLFCLDLLVVACFILYHFNKTNKHLQIKWDCLLFYSLCLHPRHTLQPPPLLLNCSGNGHINKWKDANCSQQTSQLPSSWPKELQTSLGILVLKSPRTIKSRSWSAPHTVSGWACVVRPARRPAAGCRCQPE